MKVMFYMCENSGYQLYEELGNKVKDQEVIKVPCAGKVEKDILLENLNNGIDKVLILGCFEGACNYHYGNIRCRKRVDALKKDLNELQLDGSSVEFYGFTANMKEEFKALMEKFK